MCRSGTRTSGAQFDVPSGTRTFEARFDMDRPVNVVEARVTACATSVGGHVGQANIAYDVRAPGYSTGADLLVQHLLRSVGDSPRIMQATRDSRSSQALMLWQQDFIRPRVRDCCGPRAQGGPWLQADFTANDYYGVHASRVQAARMRATCKYDVTMMCHCARMRCYAMARGGVMR